MKRLKLLITSLALSAVFIAPLAISGSSYAGFISKNEACKGASLTEADCVANQGEDKVSGTLAAVINILSIIVGVVAVIMLFVGALRFITSGGDGSSTASARNTIIYALVGLVVAAVAQGIVKLVLQRVA